MNMLEYLTDAPVQKSVSREVLPRFFFVASGTWRVITFVNRSKQASRSLSWIFRLGSLNSYSTILLYGEVGNLKPDQTKLKKKKNPDWLVAEFLQANKMVPIRCILTGRDTDVGGQRQTPGCSP